MEARTLPAFELVAGDQVKVEDTWCIVIEDPIIDDDRTYVPTQHGAFRFMRDENVVARVPKRPARYGLEMRQLPEQPKRHLLKRADERILWATALVAVVTVAWVLLVAAHR